MSLHWVGWGALTWGASWGDIPVAETWDTSQGAARNLARNLARLREQDCTATFRTEGLSLSGPREYAASSDVVCGFTTEAWRFDGAAVYACKANGFAAFTTGGWRVDGGRYHASGNGFATFTTGAVPLQGKRFYLTTADATAEFYTVNKTMTGPSKYVVTAIQNPSDEQLGMIATLLTRKQVRVTNTSIDRRFR